MTKQRIIQIGLEVGINNPLILEVFANKLIDEQSLTPEELKAKQIQELDSQKSFYEDKIEALEIKKADLLKVSVEEIIK
jgi:hypothetical protein